MNQGVGQQQTIAGNWTNISGSPQPISLTPGKRYAVIVSVLASLKWTGTDVSSYFARGYMPAGQLLSLPPGGVFWNVEQVFPGSTSTSWIVVGSPTPTTYLAGVATTNASPSISISSGASFNPSSPSYADVIALYQDAGAPIAPIVPVAPGNIATTPPPQPTSFAGLANGLAWGLGAAVVLGVGWELWRRR